MVVRELRVDLPGEEPLVNDEATVLDHQATEFYEQLTLGQSAVDAGAIADDLAARVKSAEEGGPRHSAQMPSVAAHAGHHERRRMGRGDAPRIARRWNT